MGVVSSSSLSPLPTATKTIETCTRLGLDVTDVCLICTFLFLSVSLLNLLCYSSLHSSPPFTLAYCVYQSLHPSIHPLFYFSFHSLRSFCFSRLRLPTGSIVCLPMLPQSRYALLVSVAEDSSTLQWYNLILPMRRELVEACVDDSLNKLCTQSRSPSPFPPLILPPPHVRHTSLFVSTKSPIIPTSTYLQVERWMEGGKKEGRFGGIHDFLSSLFLR